MTRPVATGESATSSTEGPDRSRPAGPDAGLVEYVYPLNTEKFSARPLKDVSVKVELSCKRSIKSVYSPSHTVEIRRHGDRRATIGYEERNARPDTGE